MNKIKQLNLYNLYYPAVMLVYTATLLFSVRTGAFAAFLMLVVVLELLLKKKLKFGGTVDYLIVGYLVYNLLSVIWLTRSGLPVQIYIEEFSNSILPVVFYFLGKSIQDGTERFYQWFVTAVLYVSILGLILYILAPQFYLDFLMDAYISKADVDTMRVRMHSVIGSTCLGALTTYGMLASAFFMKKGEKKNMICSIILFFLNCFFAFMSNQRAAMVVAILVIVYINWLIFFVFKTIPKRSFFVEIAVIAAGIAALCLVRMDIVMKIIYRLASLPGAIGQRSEQWVVAMETLTNTWLGNGLGANGHKALAYEGAHIIADGGLVKLFCEEGVFGFSIFLFILFLVCKAALQNMKEYYVEIGLIVVTLIASLGSNIIAFQLTAPIFWFAVGRCATAISRDKNQDIITTEETNT